MNGEVRVTSSLGAIWEPTRSPNPFQGLRHQPNPLT